MPANLDTADKRSFLKMFLSRFVAAYLFIFILPFPTGYLSVLSNPNRWYHAAFDWLISTTGHLVFHIFFPLVPSNSGSGDTTYNYVELFVTVVLSFLVAVMWSGLDRKERWYPRILYWLLIYIRFYFACTMMRYGMDKLLKAQFPYPFDSLSETYGESTPLRLMWNFMGYSTAYNLFIGGGEALSGFLVLFRKTTLPGALLGIIILLNVVVLNFCFDVPVKLFALNLLLISLFIAAPYARRLAHFFWGNKTVSPLIISSRFSSQRKNAVWFSVKIVLTFCILYSITRTMKYKHATYGDGAFLQTPLFGIYHTELFIKNKDTLLPLLTDTSQWKELNLIYSKKATIRMMNDSRKNCRFVTDTLLKQIHFSYDEDTDSQSILAYVIPDANHLLIRGKLKGDSVSVLLRKQDVNKYRLTYDGFHWIHELPDNR